MAAAIQLCLGATAKNTGRGSTLATLIREGSNNPAIIKVTMVNTGPDAYKPEEYGETITVERRIMKGTGVSGYSMRGHDGKVTNPSALLFLYLFFIMHSKYSCILISIYVLT